MYPKIGIISREEKTFKRTYQVFNCEILDIIRTYHGVPIGILVDFDEDPNLEFERIVKVLNFCDGVILQGGSDFNEIDQKIVEYLYKKNIPTLGICLGMQEMGITIGGKMETFSDSHHAQNTSYVHFVEINPSSLLYQILKTNQILVNSRHHDYLTKTDLLIGAVSEDGIIEEVEDPNKKFFLGVQWHPESISKDRNSIRLFQYFFSLFS